MSLLPQRKKSAEELHQLRDQLGIPPQALPLAPPTAPQPAPPTTAQPAPPTTAQPALAAPALAYAPPLVAPVIPLSPPRRPKPVRSLRKSEREPAPPSRVRQSTSSFSKIPARRHDTSEIQELRRRDAISRFSAADHPLPFPLPAPRWVVIPGYLLALSGFACHHWQQIPLPATASAAGLALLISLYILLRRPLSRHHAGFISIITLLVLVFAALHYFPHLRHAS